MGPLQERDEGNREGSQKRATSKPIREESPEEENDEMNKPLWIVLLIIVAICFGLVACRSDSAASPDARQPEPPQYVPCNEIGAVCSLRPPRQSALVAMSLKSYTELRKSLAADDDRAALMVGTGQVSGLLSGAQVRILKVSNGHAEALVIIDNQEPGRGPGGRPLGMTGAQLAGRKVWLDISQWTRIK